MNASDGPKEVLAAIREKAGELGLRVVQVPRSSERGKSFLQVDWGGEWPEYLALAAAVLAPLLYIEAEPFDLDRENRNAITNRLGTRQRLEDEEQEWWSQRLTETTEEWRGYDGQLGYLRCVWFKEGVGHYFTSQAEWYSQYSEAASIALDEADAVKAEMRRVRTQEEAAARLELAHELARHERFPSATNDEKRRYMAQQLFLDLDDNDAREIAGLAQVVYWWDVEPEREQQARDLWARGESIKNIAALLGMSEAKVKSALEARESARANDFFE